MTTSWTRCWPAPAPSSRATPRHRHPGRCPGVARAIRQDLELHGDRSRRRGQDADRRWPGQGERAGGASTSSPPSSRVRTRCGCSRRRSSGRRSGSPPSRTRRRRWRLPTTPSTGWGGPVDPRQQPGLAHGTRHPGLRVWVNCYHAYPAHAAFGGYKKSGSSETHKMMLDHYQNTKNLLVSHDINPLGFF